MDKGYGSYPFVCMDHRYGSGLVGPGYGSWPYILSRSHILHVAIVRSTIVCLALLNIDFIKVHPFPSLRRLSIVNDCGHLWSIHVHGRWSPGTCDMSWGLCYCFGWIWQKARSSRRVAVEFQLQLMLWCCDSLVLGSKKISRTWYRTTTVERRLCSVGFPSSSIARVSGSIHSDYTEYTDVQTSIP